MYNKFLKALAWNAGAATIYKIALLAHQIALYAVMPTALYGVQSSLFALLYLAVACTNFGFDDTLLPFFSTYCKSVRNFTQLLLQSWLHVATIALFTCAGIAIAMTSFSEFLHNLQSYCNKNLFFCLGWLFFIESLKRSLIAIMQLAFLNKQIAYAQVGMLYIYICTVWSLYWWHGTISLMTIFMPMAVYATLEFGYLTRNFLTFYQRVAQETGAPSIPFKVLVLQRIANYSNQIAKVVYNQNSMILFFAYTLGFTQAAIIKFFTNIITLCYTCIAKSVGIASGVTLASMSRDDKSMVLHTRYFFHTINIRYFQFLTIFSLVMFSVVLYAYHVSMITSFMALQIIIFFIIGFLDHVGIVYEQMLIVQSKAWVLATIQIAGFLIASLCWYGYRYSLVGSLTMVSLFLIIKMIVICAIGLRASDSIK